MSKPVAVLVLKDAPSANEVEESIARVKALMPPEFLVRLSYHLEAIRLERANGGVDVAFNTHEGRVLSCDFSRREHWKIRNPSSQG